MYMERTTVSTSRQWSHTHTQCHTHSDTHTQHTDTDRYWYRYRYKHFSKQDTYWNYKKFFWRRIESWHGQRKERKREIIALIESRLTHAHAHSQQKGRSIFSLFYTPRRRSARRLSVVRVKRLNRSIGIGDVDGQREIGHSHERDKVFAPKFLMFWSSTLCHY